MRTLVTLALLLAGCTDGSGDDNNDTSDADGCPEGLFKAASADALVTNYIQNGLGLALVFDEEATLASGQPAACVSTDRRLGQWVLVTVDGPAVVFRQSLSSFGNQPIDMSEGVATVEVIGLDTFGAADWQSGTWFVDAEGTYGAVTSTFDGVGVTGAGNTISITASFEATPPR